MQHLNWAEYNSFWWTMLSFIFAGSHRHRATGRERSAFQERQAENVKLREKWSPAHTTHIVENISPARMLSFIVIIIRKGRVSRVSTCLDQCKIAPRVLLVLLWQPERVVEWQICSEWSSGDRSTPSAGVWSESQSVTDTTACLPATQRCERLKYLNPLFLYGSLHFIQT